MLLDLSRLRGGVERVDRSFDPSTFDLSGEEFRVIAPVALKAEIRKDGGVVRLTGHLATILEFECGRCLDHFPVPLAVDLDVRFSPVTPDAGGGEREVASEDLETSTYQDDVLDLGAIMREQFQLAMPMKPLCRDDCKGLCPVCGINRNRETCACRAVWVDPRLAALEKLKEGR